MEKRLNTKIVQICILSFAFLLLFNIKTVSSEVRYLYDDLGQLHKIVDESGNVATYNYDMSGNLISITRSTGGISAPEVTGISPNSARAGDTAEITISGNNLLGAALKAENQGISISDTRANETSVTATLSLSFFSTLGPTTINVNTPFGSTGIAFLVDPPPPKLGDISPASGPPTRLVTITGTGFDTTPSENIVRFNGVKAVVYSATPFVILTSVPEGATTGPITVFTHDMISNGLNFTVIEAEGPLPRIDSIVPDVGSVEGGSSVNITGSGYTSETEVFICKETVSSAVTVDTSILKIITAPGLPGNCDVLVRNKNGDAFLAGGFNYLPGPPQRIVSINPLMGLGNIPINTNLTAMFDRSVDSNTINNSSFLLVETSPAEPVSGIFSFAFDDKVLFFTTDVHLLPNTSYTLYITRDVKSVEGIPLDMPFSGSFITAGSADTASPTLTVSPEDGATDVPVNTLIVFGFSEPINPTTINVYTITVTNDGNPVSGNITLGQQNTVATFVPNSSFSQGSLVNVILSSKVTDMAGNSIKGSTGIGTDFISDFTTATTTDIVPPYVLNINPPDGAAGVNENTTISVTFNESIDPVSVNNSAFTIFIDGVQYPGQISFSSQSTIATFTPDQPLPFMSLITVTLASGISDTSGNSMPLPFTSSFTTQAGMDNYQPSIIKVSPYDSQTGIALNSYIRVTFDERINPISVTESSLNVTRGWSERISGVITVSSDGLTVTFGPSRPLLPNISYYIHYTEGIEDIAGNPLYNPGSAYFTTGIELSDTIAPQLTGISPENGSTGVPVNAHILIQFSEPVDRTTVNGNTVVVSELGMPIEGDLSLEQEGRLIRFKIANLYNLKPNTFYQVTVTTGITDTAGNPLAQGSTTGFTTADATDTIIPDVESIVPAHQATDISVDTAIEVTFTEAIDPVTVNPSTFMVGPNYWGPYDTGTYTISPDRKRVAFTPDHPLFAGKSWYYVRLLNIEDIAGNRLSERGYNFSTALFPGTDSATLPTSATVVVNPNRLFADGTSTATAQITNININGVLVPNGTKIGVSAGPAFRLDSAGGDIIGGIGSIDPRFRIFTTIGGAVTLTYQSVNLSDLLPGASKTAYIQAASVDAQDRPVSNIGTAPVSLFRGQNADIDVNPASLLADGTSYSEVGVTAYDIDSKPVPPGTRIGISAGPVYRAESLGGTINGGDVAPDNRFKIFTTITGGIVDLTYTSPALAAEGAGKAWIQVVEVDDEDSVVWLIGEKAISLSGSTGFTAPQPRVLSVSPANGQTGVSLDSPVVAEFSQPIDVSTLIQDNFNIRRGWGGYISGAFSLTGGIHGANTIVTFVPDDPWSPNSSYNIYIGTGIKSETGNPLLQYQSASFSTGVSLEDNMAPYVLRVNPPEGVTSVAINSTVSIEFSEPMSPSTINTSTLKVSSSGIGINGRVIRNSPAVFSLIPDAMLLPDTLYTITAEASVTDTAGNIMQQAFSSSFTTRAGMDNYQPNVITVSPGNSAIDVSVNTSAVITFSEPMNPLTINPGTCYITGPDNWWTSIPFTIMLSGSNTVVTLTPMHPFFAGRSYYIHITTGIKDMADNTLASESTPLFSTAIAPGTIDLQTKAAITINPHSFFANGKISTTVIISNINRSGTEVPNGTLVGVTVEPAFNQGSEGGVISGPSVGTSVDSRFLLFATEGAGITVYYTPPDLDWLKPGATANGVVQVASIDLDTRPVSLIAQGIATLFKINTASMTADPPALPADGISQSVVDVIVMDFLDNLVPDGTEVGITADHIFAPNTAGGNILGGVNSNTDDRVRIFTTSGGQLSFTYQAPSSSGPGYAVIQAVGVNAQGLPTGLINTLNINLNP